MLNREKVIAALERKRSSFGAFAQHQQEQQRSLEARLQIFYRLSKEEVMQRLVDSGQTWPGAMPTAELDRAERLCIAFPQQWRTHEEARAWALTVLRNRTVISVDGSQITPSKDFSTPVGAVQVGWFVNDHRLGGKYIKDIEFEVLGPNELQDEEERSADDLFPSSQINLLRFRLECAKLCELMAEQGRRKDDEGVSPGPPLCLFDGSFIISFAGQMRQARADQYVAALEALLACARRHHMPLVGFVDSSLSHDLTTMLDLATQQERLAGSATESTDGALVAPLLPNWGDRTPFFICARSDALSNDTRNPGRADFYKDVAFCYLRLAADRPPARIEAPLWMVETASPWAMADAARSCAEDALDLVRAECVVGIGYPYAIESADALAVISQQDRERFYGLFQQFIQQQGLEFSQARKARSKQVRR